MMIPAAEEVIMKRVQGQLDRLLATEVSDQVQTWLPAFREQVEHLSKEELLALWLGHSMHGLSSNGRDLNAEPSRSASGEKSMGTRPGPYQRRGNVERGMQRFSVNLGKMDRLNKGDLLKILCDTSGVRSKYIGRIDMQRQQSFVDVKEQKSAAFAKGFEGLQFKGRKIRVKRAG